MLALVTCVLLVGLMVLGVPIAASMGVTSIGIFTALGQGDFLAVMPQRIYVGATSLTMLAIPFFIFAGNLMNTGGITDRIFGFARACVGHWPGGLGQVNILSSVIFSGMSGAAVADAAGLGAIEMKAMNDAGFDKTFSAGITAASSTIGPVIPPSIPFVVYASIVGASVGKLFMAGFLPGLLMAVAMGISVYSTSERKGYPTEPKMPWKLRMKMFVRAIPSLMTIVIIIGGIWGGFFTPTEAAVVASAYALILGVFVYKELKPKDVLKVLKESMLQSCKTLFIIAVANFLAYFLTHQRIPNMVIEGIASVTTNPQLQILIIIGVIVGIGVNMGTKGAKTVDKYWDAHVNCDAEALADLCPDDFWNYISDTYDLTEEEAVDAMGRYMNDYADSLGGDLSYEWKQSGVVVGFGSSSQLDTVREDTDKFGLKVSSGICVEDRKSVV